MCGDELEEGQGPVFLVRVLRHGWWWWWYLQRFCGLSQALILISAHLA